MRGFAVNDGGEAVPRVGTDALPDTHDVATGGIHHGASAFFDEVHQAGLGAERWDDDNVFRIQLSDLGEVLFDGDANNTHFIKLAIHLGVVDDFSQEENAIVRKDTPGGVGEVDGTLEAVHSVWYGTMPYDLTTKTVSGADVQSTDTGSSESASSDSSSEGTTSEDKSSSQEATITDDDINKLNS